MSHEQSSSGVVPALRAIRNQGPVSPPHGRRANWLQHGLVALKAETIKWGRLPSMHLLAVVAALSALLVHGLAQAGVKHGLWPSSLDSWSGTLADVCLSLGMLAGPFVGVVGGALVAGQEFTWNTWPILLTQGPRRTVLLTAKWLWMVLLALYVTAWGTLVALAWKLLHGGSPAALVPWSGLALEAFVVVAAMAAWSGLSLLASLAFRNTSVAIAVVSGLIVASNLLGPVSWLRPYLLPWNARSLLMRVVPSLATVRLAHTSWRYVGGLHAALVVCGCWGLTGLVAVATGLPIGRRRLG